MLFFGEAHSYVDAFVDVVDIGLWLRGKVDEAVLAVSLAVVFDGFADLGDGEDVTFVEREKGFESIDFKRERFVRIGADDFEAAHLVALALFDGNGNVNGFPLRAARERDAQAVPFRVDIFENWLADDDLEIAVVLIEAANAYFEIFVEFFAIVRLREDRYVGDVQRDGVGPVVLHGPNQLAFAEPMIAGELDVADLDLRAFFNLEDQDDGVAGRDALILGCHLGELAPVLA